MLHTSSPWLLSVDTTIVGTGSILTELHAPKVRDLNLTHLMGTPNTKQELLTLVVCGLVGWPHYELEKHK